MNITNPTTFGSPNLTLSTSNSSGTGGALRSDDTILVYDTSAVDAITFGQSGSVGEASTASRRDHAHAMAADPSPVAASQAEMVAGTSATTFASPARTQFHPAVAKGHVNIRSDGAGTTGTPYNFTGVSDDGAGNRVITWDTDYSAQAQQGSLSIINLNGVAGYSVVHSTIGASTTQLLIFDASNNAADSATFTVAWGNLV